MKRDGYNLFVLGPPGQGKRTMVKKYLEQISSLESNGVAPSDWCYVHNFVDTDKPQAIQLAAGRGRELQKDVEKLTEELQAAIPDALEEDTHKHRIEESTKSVFGENESKVENLFNEAKESGLTIGRTQSGTFVIAGPDKHEDGTPHSPEEEEVATRAAKDLQPRIEKLLNEVPKLRKEAMAKAKEISKECAQRVVDELMAPLRTKYAEYDAVMAHLDAIEEDLVENFERIRPSDDDNESPIAMLNQPKRLSFEKFLINVFVDNSGLEGAPVIYEEHPYYHNLCGRIDHASLMGSLVTNFSLIKAGALHKANGGYLVLNARDVLLQPFAWEALKRAIRLHKAQIESLGAELSLISTVTIQPEPIELNVKVVLLGDRLLYYHDPDLPPLTGFPALLVVHEWLRISNADGSWVGQSGPHFVATDIELEGNKRQRRKARRQGSFLVTGPTILSGAGAYEGLTAYLYFPFEANEDLQRGNPKDDADDAGEPFKAVIVNRVNPGFPTEDQLALRVRDYTAPPTE